MWIVNFFTCKYKLRIFVWFSFTQFAGSQRLARAGFGIYKFRQKRNFRCKKLARKYFSNSTSKKTVFKCPSRFFNTRKSTTGKSNLNVRLLCAIFGWIKCDFKSQIQIEWWIKLCVVDVKLLLLFWRNQENRFIRSKPHWTSMSDAENAVVNAPLWCR